MNHAKNCVGFAMKAKKGRERQRKAKVLLCVVGLPSDDEDDDGNLYVTREDYIVRGMTQSQQDTPVWRVGGGEEWLSGAPSVWWFGRRRAS